MEMSPMPESAKALLVALIDIEDRAKAQAREGGCTCSKKYPGTDRCYPLVSFNRDTAVGKPYDQIPWEMQHEPGCPMDGQSGVG